MQFQGPTSRSESWRWLNHHLATLSSYYLLFPLSAICSAFLPFAFTAFLDNSQSNRLPRDEALIDRKIVPDNVPTTGTAPSVALPALRLRYPSLSVVSLLKSDCLILKVIHLARKASERARILCFVFSPFLYLSFFLGGREGMDGYMNGTARMILRFFMIPHLNDDDDYSIVGISILFYSWVDVSITPPSSRTKFVLMYVWSLNRRMDGWVGWMGCR